jgi:D-alanyl-lipoteichoic acid acyltransferase DltB (MBOAT superfamily)
MSLSSWLKDYLYISLGGNRVGKLRQYLNLMLTMLLGGLWHGASFNFILWGGMHGAALAVDKMRIALVDKLPKWNVVPPKLVKLLGVVIIFHFVCFCWIFFKASTFGDAGIILTQIFTNFNASSFLPLITAYKTVVGILLLGYIIHFVPQSYQYVSEKILSKITLVGRIVILLIFIWIIIQVKQADQVMPIYLQF